MLEKEAGGIKEGLAARVILDARPGYEFEAEVTTVAALANSIERESPVNYFEVILSLEKTYPEFMKPGSFTQATIFIEKQDQVLAVPNQVIFHEGEENWVWLVHKDKAEKRVVTLGRRGPTRTIITAGLESGDMIALSAPQGEN